MLIVTSSAFKHNKLIPSKYTCEGSNVNPPLKISNIPKNTKSLALIMDDPDAPGKTWDHWIVWNIPANKETIIIEEDSMPGEQGLKSWPHNSYGGPCPPSGTHRYFFKIYALDAILKLSSSTNKTALEKAIQSHILSRGELVGLYKKYK